MYAVEELPEDVPPDVVDEVMTRTPGCSGWQQEQWQFHCGDGAALLGITDGGPAIYHFRCRHCGTELSYSDYS